MATGQVGFKQPKTVKKVHIDMRINAIVNRLNKTKEERFPDFAQEKIDYEKDLKRREVTDRQKRQKEELRIARERKQLRWEKDHGYETMYNEEDVRHSSNQFRADDWEDDFM